MPIPKTMRAAVVERFREPLVMRELPVPTPGPGQALVEIIASGVCHTDLHAADGDWPVKPGLPITPGHEGAGIVVALGPGVTHLKEGDRVGIAWLHSACGHCDFCLSGWETLCLEQKNSGYSVNGSFAQYALAQAGYVGRITKNLPFVDAAPILCAGVTTYKGLKETNTRPGEWVAVAGGRHLPTGKIVLRTTRLSKCRCDGQSRPQSDDRDTIGCALSGLMHCLNKLRAVNSFKDFSRPSGKEGERWCCSEPESPTTGAYIYADCLPLILNSSCRHAADHTLSNPCSAASKDSAEHSQVEFKRPGLLEFEPRKVRVIRIQEHVPFASDGRRRDVQGSAGRIENPSVAVRPQRFISRLIPVTRKGFHIQPFGSHLVRNFGLNRDQIVGS